MKKFLLLPLLLLLPVGFLTTSCSDDENGGGVIAQTYMSGDYTLNGNYNLSLEVDGQDVTEGNPTVKISTPDNATAQIELQNVMSSQSLVKLENVPLKQDTETNIFTFSGTKQLNDGTSITYSGELVYKSLKLKITSSK